MRNNDGCLCVCRLSDDSIDPNYVEILFLYSYRRFFLYFSLPSLSLPLSFTFCSLFSIRLWWNDACFYASTYVCMYLVCVCVYWVRVWWLITSHDPRPWFTRMMMMMANRRRQTFYTRLIILNIQAFCSLT